MRDRYCATEDCEPCQAGNRAALSRNHRVPQSCRFRAQTAERQPGVRFRIDRVRSCGALNGNSIETTLSIEAMYRACGSDTSKRDKSSDKRNFCSDWYKKSGRAGLFMKITALPRFSIEMALQAALYLERLEAGLRPPLCGVSRVLPPGAEIFGKWAKRSSV